MSSSTMESQLWMDLKKYSEGMVNWNSPVILYASSRAPEWVVCSGLYHQSFDKVRHFTLPTGKLTNKKNGFIDYTIV